MVPSLWPMDERPFGMNNLYEKESHSPNKSVVPWTIGCSPDAKKKTALKALAFFFHSFIHSLACYSPNNPLLQASPST